MAPQGAIFIFETKINHLVYLLNLIEVIAGFYFSRNQKPFDKYIFTYHPLVLQIKLIDLFLFHLFLPHAPIFYCYPHNITNILPPG